MIFFGHPWRGGLQWKLDALRYRQMNSFIAVARDRDTGRGKKAPGVLHLTPFSGVAREHLSFVDRSCRYQGGIEKERKTIS